MNTDELKKYWKSEENTAYINGWNFSHIDGRFKEHEISWNYNDIVRNYLDSDKKLLDIDTGGGEVLLSFNHPNNNTSATEGYPPNVRLCRQILTPLGIDFHEMTDYSNMPFKNQTFDIVTNRHGAYNAKEISRVLKDDGIFITQQVGGQNDRELVQLLCPYANSKFDNWNLNNALKDLSENSFNIICAKEEFRPIDFFDTGALVWFAKVISWEFIDFSVENNFEQLLKVHRIIKESGKISGNIHRFLIIAEK